MGIAGDSEGCTESTGRPRRQVHEARSISGQSGRMSGTPWMEGGEGLPGWGAGASRSRGQNCPRWGWERDIWFGGMGFRKGRGRGRLVPGPAT